MRKISNLNNESSSNEQIKKCNILGVNISAVNMKDVLNYINKNIGDLKGKYICVSNVHTTVMSYENEEFKKIQNKSILSIPDGKPLSIVCRMKGFKKADRVTGPDLMDNIFKISVEKGYTHFFYGSTESTLKKMMNNLKHKYKGLKIVGEYSPPFRKLTEDEENNIINIINETKADFVWVGLGAPKQEQWMYSKKDKIKSLMIGVGAGFDYFAGNIKRAPIILQKLSLEWLYRLLQDPKRLWKRYMSTNWKFIYLLICDYFFPKKNLGKTKNKKPTILVAHNHYQIVGGEDSVVKNEIELLKNNGHKVILYSRNNKEINDFNIFKKLMLPFTAIFSLKTYREVKNIIKSEKIDILHVHNTLSLISPSIYYAAFKCKIPVVQTVHNFRLACPGATFTRNGEICEDCLTKGLICAIKNKCYRNSYIQTFVSTINIKIHRMIGTYFKINYICLTEFNKMKLLEVNKGNKKIIDENKVFVKPNFVKSQDIIIPYENRKNQIIFVGRLDKLKGIHILLEAWKSIKDINLIICGTGPEEEFVRKFVLDNNMGNVEIKGFVENRVALEMIAESKALIMPSQWYEGFPMTIVEAFCCGTPVIGSDIGNVGNLIIENNAGLVFKYNSSADIVEVVKTLKKINSDLSVTDIVRIFNTKYLEEINYIVLEKIYKQSLYIWY